MCRDCEDAARRRDGAELLGQRIRCEVAKGGDPRGSTRPVNARSTGYRVVVKNLPRGASWQDLKVGRVLFSKALFHFTLHYNYVSRRNKNCSVYL
jgi:hypothetical protein